MKKIFFFIAVMPLLILPACFKMPRYRKPDLQAFFDNPSDVRKKDNVVVKVSVLDPQMCEKFFGPRGKRILQNRPHIRFVPCHLSIKNKSARSLILKRKNISLSLIPAERIIKRISVFTPHRMGPFMASATVLGIAQTAIVPAGLFCGYSFINMMKWSYYNEDLAQEIQNLCLSSPIIIDPNQQVDCILFFKESEFKKYPLNITLYDEEDYDYTLNFTLHVNA